MSRERRAVVHHVQDGGKSAVALLSRSASVDREKWRSVEGRAEARVLAINWPQSYVGAKRHRTRYTGGDQLPTPSLTGIKPGRHFSRSARAGNDGTSSGASAWYAVLTVGGRRAPSASAHGEHLAGRDMTPRHPLQDSVLPLLVPSSVPLSDIPAGQSEVGVVSVHNRSAATVTQAGGLNGLPAFSSFVQRQAGEPGVTQRHSGLKRLPASVGGVTWGTWY